jgi:hypothetical protein
MSADLLTPSDKTAAAADEAEPADSCTNCKFAAPRRVHRAATAQVLCRRWPGGQMVEVQWCGEHAPAARNR